VRGKSNNLVFCIHFWGVHKLQTATISYVLSLCLSVCPYVFPSAHLQGTRIMYHEIWYLGILRKSVKEIKVSLKSDKNNEYFT
jgi:hypothetical protein